MAESETLHVERPWGGFRRFILNKKCTVKIHTVKENQSCSLQSHKNRSELFIPLDKGIVVERDGEIIETKPYDEIYIPAGSKHSFSSRLKDARILEICFGEFDEDDIVRYEDMYGRV